MAPSHSAHAGRFASSDDRNHSAARSGSNTSHHDHHTGGSALGFVSEQASLRKKGKESSLSARILEEHLRNRDLADRAAKAERMLAHLEAQLRAKDQKITLLQARIRHLILTHYCELEDADLDVPDPWFADAEASGVYTLPTEQVVHLLLKKEAVIGGLVRRLHGAKLQRDHYRIQADRTNLAVARRGVADVGVPPTRPFHLPTAAWIFNDRTTDGIEAAKDVMEAEMRNWTPRDGGCDGGGKSGRPDIATDDDLLRPSSVDAVEIPERRRRRKRAAKGSKKQKDSPLGCSKGEPTAELVELWTRDPAFLVVDPDLTPAHPPVEDNDPFHYNVSDHE